MRVRDYQILREIGNGGFGKVYLAEKDGKFCALKEIRGAIANREAGAIKTFRESLLEKPIRNIVPIFESFQEGGALYYSMPLSDGVEPEVSPLDKSWSPKTLEYVISGQINRKKWFTREDVASIFIPIIRAVGELNERNIVHRDIKPANVLFFNGAPTLADIGLMTYDGKSLSASGTPDYMPPTWYLKTRGKPDMWGVGATLFAFLTSNTPDCLGRTAYMWPPQGKNGMPTRDIVAWEKFHNVIFRITSQEAKERYIRFSDIADDIKKIADGQDVVFPDVKPCENSRRRNLWASTAAFALLAALTYAGAVHFFDAEPAPDETLGGADATAVDKKAGKPLSENPNKFDPLKILPPRYLPYEYDYEELDKFYNGLCLKIKEGAKGVSRPDAYDKGIENQIEDMFSAGEQMGTSFDEPLFKYRPRPKKLGLNAPRSPVEEIPEGVQKVREVLGKNYPEETEYEIERLSGLLTAAKFDDGENSAEFAKIFDEFHRLVTYYIVASNSPIYWGTRVADGRFRLSADISGLYLRAIYHYSNIGEKAKADELIKDCMANRFFSPKVSFSKYRGIFCFSVNVSYNMGGINNYRDNFPICGAYGAVICDYMKSDPKLYGKSSEFVRYAILKTEEYSMGAAQDIRHNAVRHTALAFFFNFPRLMEWIAENDPITCAVMAPYLNIDYLEYIKM